MRRFLMLTITIKVIDNKFCLEYSSDVPELLQSYLTYQAQIYSDKIITSGKKYALRDLRNTIYTIMEDFLDPNSHPFIDCEELMQLESIDHADIDQKTQVLIEEMSTHIAELADELYGLYRMDGVKEFKANLTRYWVERLRDYVDS